MKHTLPLAIAAALASLASASSFAQSNVTIYGRLNSSVEHIDRAGTKGWEVVDSASRIGFKGQEDLGGGLFAGFQIEHGFRTDTGGLGRSTFWGRQSEVNIGSKSLGTIRLGNFTSEAYYATADWVSLHNHDTGTSSDALYAYLPRDTDKVGYHSPDFGGLTFDVAATTDDAAGTDEKSYDVAANYNLGNLHLGAGYQKFDEANQFALSALYTMGSFTFGGYVQRDDNGFAADTGGLGKRTSVRLVGMYALGASEFHANVGRAGDYSDVDNSAATQYTLAYNYNLSKRTKVYSFFTKVNDDQAGVYGGDFRSFALGVRHNF